MTAKLPTFSEWVAHWGEARLAERIAASQKSHRLKWEHRNDEVVIAQGPAWELRLGVYWEENVIEWHERWTKCGGKLFEERMIAATWDNIWEQLSRTFYDGLGQPCPPYARSSCADWYEIDSDEAIVLGVIEESEYKKRLAAFPYKPLLDRDGNPMSKEALEKIMSELDEYSYQHGGPRPGASRAERVAHKRQQQKEAIARMQTASEKRNQEIIKHRIEQASLFNLLEDVERSLRELPTAHDDKRWDWLCESLKQLTTTNDFDRYPSWQARAWVACAEMHRSLGAESDELLCLQRAVEINPQLSVKRRIKILSKKVVKNGDASSGSNQTTNDAAHK